MVRVRAHLSHMCLDLQEVDCSLLPCEEITFSSLEGTAIRYHLGSRKTSTSLDTEPAGVLILDFSA
jgi:hypothetical protein